MRYIFVPLIAILTFTQLGFGQTDSSAKAKEILGIEQALSDGLPGDSVLWEKYLDPTWYVITEDGTGYNKIDFLKTFGPFPAGYSGNIKVIHPVISFYNDIAIVHQVSDENEFIFGQKLHTTYAVEDIWRKTDSSWTMLGMQIFEIPQLPPAIMVNEQILKQYTGIYQAFWPK